MAGTSCGRSNCDGGTLVAPTRYQRFTSMRKP
ncbi:hypothetical protein M2243_002431 [Heliophilum fasciatum]|nr:hypothetical protein [Heliophilum fasciatum]